MRTNLLDLSKETGKRTWPLLARGGFTVTSEIGLIALEKYGERPEMERGIPRLKSKGVIVEPIEKRR